MKHAKTALAALIATAFVGTAAFAQNNVSTTSGASPKLGATAAAASGPDSRADVKAEGKAANRSGEAPKGEAQAAKKHSKGEELKDETKPAAPK